IAVSKATKLDLIKKIKINPEKVTVAYEGYNKDKFKKDPEVNSLKGYYLFVGTVQPRKNLERVIKAVAKIKNKNLIIVGSRGWLSDKIYQLPKELGIEDRVKFLGHVPDEELPPLYSNAEALLFPSLFEGFGLPILEAQACGCPVITSNISSMPEVAGKGAIYVDPYSVDDIVKGMQRLPARHRYAQALAGEQAVGYRQKLIKKGFENVKRFSWEKCARETLKVLEGVK
ncbi:MAG: glycosyltransferase family 1 protein, partial [Candidatus Daviesbacteria bacterium]|nr:glycosyltransferase family 1 protein [Candidatus Daviesbacteria bacterium]